MSHKHTYTLTALQHFKCLAGDCPDTCCRNWDISVDAGTEQRWRSLDDEDTKKYLFDNLVSKSEDGERVVVLAMNGPGKTCAHLTNDALCGLQTRWGAQFMPAICRDYPRIQAETTATCVCSATLSCPEIARLVLFGEGAPFETTAGAPPGTRVTAMAGALPERLQEWVNDVLSTGKFPLNVRIHYLARTLGELAALHSQGLLDLQRLDRLCRAYKDALYGGNLAVKNNKLRPDPFTAGSFWHSMYRFGEALYATDDEGVSGSPLQQALASAASDKSARYATIYEHIKTCRDSARALLAPFHGAFEAYLNVLFLNYGFPWNPPGGNYIASFIAAVTCFAMVQLKLWLKAYDSGRLTPEDIVDAVYKVGRHIGHNDRIFKNLERYPHLLRVDQYDTCLIDIY